MIDYVNKSISSSIFPLILKLAEITSAYKKGSLYEEINFQPMRVLPNLSKFFERVLYEQSLSIFEKYLSNYQIEINLKY